MYLKGGERGIVLKKYGELFDEYCCKYKLAKVS